MRILFIPGFCSGPEMFGNLPDTLRAEFGDAVDIQILNKNIITRASTAAYLADLKKYHEPDQNQILIGHSFGAQISNLLLAQGFARRAILLAPVMPSEWLQLSLPRAGLFARQIFFDKPFRFTESQARRYVLAGVDDLSVAKILPTFHDEPASLVREYAWRKRDTYIGQAGLKKIRTFCSGLVISGSHDVLTPTNQQAELASLLSFPHLILPGGHSPHLIQTNALQIHRTIAEFVFSHLGDATLPMAS